MNTPKTLFDVLQVSRHAETKTIDDAYRSIAKRYHPDINKDPQATTKMREINEAYEILKDPIKREQYRIEIEYLEQEAFKKATAQAIEKAKREAEREAAAKAKQNNTPKEQQNYPSYSVMLDAATKSFEAEKYDDAYRIATSALTLYPDDERANKIVKDVIHRRDWLNRYTRLSQSLQDLQSQARILQSEWTNSKDDKQVFSRLLQSRQAGVKANEVDRPNNYLPYTIILATILLLSSIFTISYYGKTKQTSLKIKLPETETLAYISQLISETVFSSIGLTIALISAGLLLWIFWKNNKTLGRFY